MSELKPCPFCGHKARVTVHDVVYASCPKCYAWTFATTETEAIKRWNTRPIEDDLRKRLEDALGEVEHLKDTRQDPYDQIEVLQAENNKFRAEIERLNMMLDGAQATCEALGKTAVNFAKQLAEHEFRGFEKRIPEDQRASYIDALIRITGADEKALYYDSDEWFTYESIWNLIGATQEQKEKALSKLNQAPHEQTRCSTR